MPDLDDLLSHLKRYWTERENEGEEETGNKDQRGETEEGKRGDNKRERKKH